VTASATVEPAQLADMSFVIPGAVTAITAAEGQVVHAGDSLMTLDAPDLSFALQAALQELKSATSDEFIQSSGRRKWDGFKFVWMAGPPEQRQVAHARTLRAQAGVAAAQAELAQATLRAPFDGTVVSIKVSQGEQVQPGEVALVIGNLGHLQVKTTDLSEREIARVHVGQRVLVHLKSMTDPLVGTVTRIAPRSELSEDGDTVYPVTIELDKQDPALLCGMTGDVELFPLR
jgi:HlyD family secretion protein